ncbi:MAG: HDOD domain-containing protein [Chromatiales bacterium]|nr:HDOD domain-containing protein [Chromatiales bacterium]
MARKPLRELIDERIQEDNLKLPVAHNIALKLQQALRDPKSDAKTMERLILEDQALAGQILKVANSAFFAGLNKVETIQRALVRLGLKQVANLAMVATQQAAYTSKNKMLASHMEPLWKQSLASAIGCQWIARRTGFRDRADEAFLAGLLHDIGKLLILKVLDEIASEQGNTTQFSAPLIREILDNMHNEHGHALLMKWNLPEIYAVIARDHHQETLDPNNVLIAMVRLVDLVCLKIGLEPGESEGIVLAATPEAQVLGISEIHLAELEILLEDTAQQAIAA